MKFQVYIFVKYFIFCLIIVLLNLVLTIKCTHGVAVKYEAHLEDGTLVAKSDGVEFTVNDGQCLLILLLSLYL